MFIKFANSQNDSIQNFCVLGHVTQASNSKHRFDATYLNFKIWFTYFGRSLIFWMPTNSEFQN